MGTNENTNVNRLHDDEAKLALIRDVGFARYFRASRWRDYNRQFFDGLAEKYDATNELHSFGTKHRFDRLAVDRMGTVGESFFQFWAGPGRNLDCVDLHHGHGAKVTAPAKGQGRAKIGG